MESIRGKHAVGIDPAALARHISGYQHLLIDLGTGAEIVALDATLPIRGP